jgi:hypothetical protein
MKTELARRPLNVTVTLSLVILFDKILQRSLFEHLALMCIDLCDTAAIVYAIFLFAGTLHITSLPSITITVPTPFAILYKMASSIFIGQARAEKLLSLYNLTGVFKAEVNADGNFSWVLYLSCMFAVTSLYQPWVLLR